MTNTLALAKVIKPEHEKKWIALVKDNQADAKNIPRIIAYDESLLELKRKTGNQKVVFMKVPPSDVFLSL